MKYYFTAVLMILLMSKPGKCQKGSVWLSGGPSMGFAVSNKNFSYYYKNGIGGNLQANFGTAQLGSVTAHLSYLSFGAKKFTSNGCQFLNTFKSGVSDLFFELWFFCRSRCRFFLLWIWYIQWPYPFCCRGYYWLFI